MARALSHRNPAPSIETAPRVAKRRPIGLAGLRGFAAAARHLSFTLAAAELNLTQSAISRQVGSLEEELGHALFVRKTRALVLTPAGAQLFRAVFDGLGTVDHCVERIRGVSASPRVTISTYSSFASLWLVPKLASFQRAHPLVEIRIDASDHMVNLERDGIDLAMRRCRPENTPPGATALLDEDMTPVLSAELKNRLAPKGLTAKDLLSMPLIDLDSRMPNDPDSWESWFALAGVDVTRRARAGMLFVGYSDQVIQAASRGQGVALAQSSFYRDMVAAGELIAPFASVRLVTGYRMVLVENAETRGRPEVRLLRDWLLGQFPVSQRPAAGRRTRPPRS